MNIKEFWKLNKMGYITSCIAFTLLAILLGIIKKYDSSVLLIAILFSYPAIFLMALGISSLNNN